MLRKIIEIDAEKCDGCGLCVDACHEGALQLIEGKAVLVSDSYCDGLGDCLPECPMGAIKIVEREAAAFDEAAVKERMAAMSGSSCAGGGCSQANLPRFNKQPQTDKAPIAPCAPSAPSAPSARAESELAQWPCQLKLVPVNAPYFRGADLLLAADCTAFAYANIHQDFMKNKITLIACPKLDMVDYSEKLAEIIRNNEIKSVTILKMEVPCCGGLLNMATRALQMSGKMIPWQYKTITTAGEILEN